MPLKWHTHSTRENWALQHNETTVREKPYVRCTHRSWQLSESMTALQNHCTEATNIYYLSHFIQTVITTKRAWTRITQGLWVLNLTAIYWLYFSCTSKKHLIRQISVVNTYLDIVYYVDYVRRSLALPKTWAEVSWGRSTWCPNCRAWPMILPGTQGESTTGIDEQGWVSVLRWRSGW